MKVFSSKLFYTLFFVVSVFIFAPNQVNACDAISQPNGFKLRPAGNHSNIVDWYTEANPPWIYADIKTTNCEGWTIGVQIIEGNLSTTPTTSSFLSDFLSGSLFTGGNPIVGLGYATYQAFENDLNPSSAAENSNVVGDTSWPSNDITFPFVSGEDECNNIPGGSDCELWAIAYAVSPDGTTSYPIGIEGSMLDGSFSNPVIGYECDGQCFDDFQAYPPIAYGTTHPNDTQQGNQITPVDNPFGSTGASEDLLAPIPFFQGQQAGLGDLLNSLIQVMLVIAGVGALIMIIIGGVTYMTSDALDNKNRGRELITNAILGLILALGSWIILNTLNPNLTENLGFNVQTIDITPNYEFSEPGIVSNYTPPSADLDCPDCVNIDSSILASNNRGVKPAFIDKINQLNNNLNAAGISWRVTEAFPPTANHRHNCHYTGRCIDANFFPIITPTTEQVNAFIGAATDAGLFAVYETNSSSQYQQLITAGLPYLNPYPGGITSGVLVWPQITAPHFSVYCGTACN